MNTLEGKPDIYFVLNGLINGEDGEYAITCGSSDRQPDGWYWIKDGMEDGKGPFESRQAAKLAANAEPSRYTFFYTIPNGGISHFRPYKEEDFGSEDVTVKVTTLGPNHYRLECEQYYSSGWVCQLEISQHLERALKTFASVLRADNEYEQEDTVAL